MVLSKDRVRWIQAKLGGTVTLGQTKEEFVGAIKATKDRKAIEKMNKLWKDNLREQCAVKSYAMEV